MQSAAALAPAPRMEPQRMVRHRMASRPLPRQVRLARRAPHRNTPVANSEVARPAADAALRRASAAPLCNTRAEKAARCVSWSSRQIVAAGFLGWGFSLPHAAPSGRMAQACELAGCRPTRPKRGTYLYTSMGSRKRLWPSMQPAAQRQKLAPVARSGCPCSTVHCVAAKAPAAGSPLRLRRRRLAGAWQRWTGPAGPSRHFARPCSWRSRALFRGGRHLPAHLQTVPTL